MAVPRLTLSRPPRQAVGSRLRAIFPARGLQGPQRPFQLVVVKGQGRSWRPAGSSHGPGSLSSSSFSTCSTKLAGADPFVSRITAPLSEFAAAALPFL